MKRSSPRDFFLATVLSSLVLACVGCGGGSPLVEMTGVVMLDGAPLPDAHVVFTPVNGRPSLGKTDQDGKYQLRFTTDLTGAIPGEHTVRITTSTNNVEENGGTVAKELLPARYNSKTTLKVTVAPGHGTHDFMLESK